MAQIELLVRLTDTLSQDDYVERLGEEQMTDCICGLGLGGHVALLFDDDGPDCIEYVGALVLAVSMIEEDAKIVRISAPVVGLNWKLPG